MTEEKQTSYFSFRGLLATGVSAFLTFKIYQVTEILKEAESRYQDNAFFRSFIDLIRYSSPKGESYVDNAYAKLKTVVFVFLISYVLKTALSFKHAFINDTDNATYVSYLFLAEAVVLGLFIGFEPFSDYFRAALVIGIPSFILYSLMDE